MTDQTNTPRIKKSITQRSERGQTLFEIVGVVSLVMATVAMIGVFAYRALGPDGYEIARSGNVATVTFDQPVELGKRTSQIETEACSGGAVINSNKVSRKTLIVHCIPVGS